LADEASRSRVVEIEAHGRVPEALGPVSFLDGHELATEGVLVALDREALLSLRTQRGSQVDLTPTITAT
jgi:hypothetical protein